MEQLADDPPTAIAFEQLEVINIAPAIAEAIDLHFQADSRPFKQLLLDYLRCKQLLLMLDNAVMALLAQVPASDAVQPFTPP